MRHNKRRIYFKNIYKTDFRLKTLMFKKETQKKHTYAVDGLINGGGGGGAYIRNNIFVGKWMGLYRGGGLKSGILRYS